MISSATASRIPARQQAAFPVSPIGTVGASFSRDEMVAACRVLDESAKEVGVDFIGGFGALVEKGMTPGEKNLIDALPEALAVTDRICSSINVGSTKAGINMDAVRLHGAAHSGCGGSNS